MSFERTESTVELRIVHFQPTAPEHEGLSAQFDPQTGGITIRFASIEGQSALEIPASRLPALASLLSDVAAESPPSTPQEP